MIHASLIISVFLFCIIAHDPSFCTFSERRIDPPKSRGDFPGLGQEGVIRIEDDLFDVAFCFKASREFNL